MAEMDRSVSQSFAKVKQDTDTLYQWVTYLNAQNQQLVEQNAALKRLTEEQKLALNELKVTVQHLPKTPHEIKQIVEQYYSFDPILQRIKHIEQKIELLEMRRERSPFRPLDHSTPSVSAPPARETASTNLKDKLMRKLARNSKDYIKNLVLGLVHKYGKMGALQLREMVVDEQGLCSKSSFYRILEEMEKENSLQVISDGKHTVYVASSTHATV
ncbi:MAG: hypothetical protein MN733_05350 [Nitrososphaera sp.]|nr:hypothetical protein [Nitrososphaera sp.]